MTPITVTLTFTDAAAAAAALAQLAGVATVAPAATGAQKPGKSAKGEAPAPSPPSASPTPTPPADAAPATQATGSIPYAPIGEKISRLVAKDRPAAVALLASFKGEDGAPCKKGPQVLPADYPALDAKLDAALAAAEESMS